MRFRHDLTGKNTVKRVVSFLLMLCLLVPMLPSSIGLDAKADNDTTEETTTSTNTDTVTITLHDLYIDRKEALPDGTDLTKLAEDNNDNTTEPCLLAYKYARKITVPKGTTLKEIFNKASAEDADADLKKNTTLGTKSLQDTGVYKKAVTPDAYAMTSVANAKDCVWYTRDDSVDNGGNGGVDGNGTRTQVTGNTVINEDTNLFTYSYRIRLITGESQYRDLIVREKHTKGFVYGEATTNEDNTSISDFLSNADNTTWTDVNEGTTTTELSAMAAKDITRNYAFRAGGVKANTQNISYYVAENGEWKNIKTVPMDTDRVDVWGRTGPALNYYVTDKELEDVYGGEYGFKTSYFKDGVITKQKNGYFPYSTESDNYLHIRQMPKYETVNGTTQFRVPLIEDTGNTTGLAVYYTPNNITEYSSSCFLEGSKNGNGSVKKDNAAVLQDNSFYTVSVDKKDSFNGDLPKELNKKYLNGSKVEFKLPLKDKDNKTVQWYVEKGGDNVTIEDSADGTTATVTISGIDSQLILTTDKSQQFAGGITVHFYAIVDGEEKEVDTLHFSESQHEKHDEWGESARYYVSTQTLEEVYADYGFKASEYKGERYFPNTVHETDQYNDATLLWANATAIADNSGYYKIPLTDLGAHNSSEKENKKNIDVVYAPHNNSEHASSYFGEDQTQGKSRGDTNVVSDNTFYSVSIDEEDATKFESLPKTKYILNGESSSITLPLKDKYDSAVSWYAESGSELVTIAKNNEYKATITVNNISKQIVLTTDLTKQDTAGIKVHCYVLINQQPVEVGIVTTTSYQRCDNNEDWGTGNNQTRYYVTAKQVSTIYQGYGFDLNNFDPAKNENQQYCFAVANTKDIDQWNNPSIIWPDTKPRTLTGSEDIKIPVVSQANGDASNNNFKNIDLYYVSNNTNKQEDGIWIKENKYKKTVDTDFLRVNSFYSVTVEDTTNIFSESELPEKQYVLYGDTAEVAVPHSDGVTWSVWNCFLDGTTVNKHSEYTSSSSESDQITYTVKNICRPILVTTSTDYKEVFDAENCVKVTPYIAVNGEWVEAKTDMQGQEIDKTHISNGKYYITAKELEHIYSQYGFKASDVTIGAKLYQIGCEAGSKPGAIWADNDTVASDDSWILTLVDKKYTEIQLYYLPKNTTEKDYGAENPKSNYTRDQAATQNSFYSVEVTDTGENFSADRLPEKKYYLAGTDVEMSLPLTDAVKNWYIKEGNNVILSQKSNSILVSIPSIDHKVTLTTVKSEQNSTLVTLHCYVIINKQEVELDTVYFDQSQKDKHEKEWGSNDTHSSNRYYISTQVLEKVYKEYNFTAEKYKGERYFPCTSHIAGDGDDPSDLWADAVSVPIEGSTYYKVPLLWAGQNKKNIDIFYTPHNTVGYESYFSTSKQRRDNSAFLSDNTFYPITFEDPGNKFLGVTLPDTQYALTGTDKTVTLPYDEKVNWFRDSKKIEPDKNSISNGKANYIVSKVTQATKVTTDGVADDEVAVQGYISLDGEWKKLPPMTIKTDQQNDGKFYLTSDQLETLFGSYGFKASDYSLNDAEKLGQHFLNPENPDSSDLVATSAVWSSNTWHLTTSVTEAQRLQGGIKLYYVPNHTADSSADKLEEENTFYSISFADDGNTGIDVPDTQYVLKGSDKTIELPIETSWFCTASAEGAQIALSDSTFQITKANQSLKFNTKLKGYAVTVHSRVFVDDEPEDVATVYLKDQAATDWGDSRYYVTAKTLSLIYSAYGFDSSTYHPDADKGNEDPQNLWFPNAVHEQEDQDKESNNPEVLWDDTPPKDSDGNGYKIALPKTSSGFTNFDLYYAPNTTQEHMVVKDKNNHKINNSIYIGSSLDSNKSHTVNLDFINANSFYSIQFQDPDDKLSGAKLPETERHLSGTTNVKVTVPYREGVTWNVTDKQGNPLDMSDISQTKDETNKTVTFTIPKIDQPLVLTTADGNKDSVSENTVALNAYVAIDDEWVPVGSEWTEVDGELTGGTYSISDTQYTNDKYYITARQLKNIFGKYGFTGTLPTDKNPFAHNTIIPNAGESLQANQRLIYADVLPDKQYIQTIQVKLKETGIAVYYVPNGYGTESKWRKDDAGLLKANSLQYTVSVADPNHLLTDTNLPEAKRWDRETEATITLPTLSGDLKWVPVNAKTREKITDGITSTNNVYKIASITQPIEFIVQKTTAITIQYDVGFADSDKQSLGSDFPVDKVPQTVLEDGTIQGATSYWDYLETGSAEYVTLKPDRDYVQVEVFNNSSKRIEPREFYYTFKGWKIVTNDNSASDKTVDIESGGKIDLTNYSNSTTLKLKSVWEAYDAHDRPNTVNFYLSTSCEVKDNISNGFQGQAKENFTTTIYSTRIYGTSDITSNQEFQVIAPPNNESTAYQTDKTLRESVDTAIPYSDGNAQITLESFPSDEEILSTLRRRVKAGVAKVTMDGNEIPASDLNTTNYEVRWYVLKYHKADSWHIDGVLVAKEGHVIVTKTFDGDEDAIQYVKNQKKDSSGNDMDGTAYAISVTHESDDSDGGSDAKNNTLTRENNNVVDYMLALEPKDKTDDDSIIRGYDSYDEATDTYTWILSGRQGREYTLQEQNYQVFESQHQWSGTYQYMIRNSPTASTDTDGWLNYQSNSGGGKKITLKAAAYASDAPKESYQTVSFKNTYAPYGSISLAKIDATTGSPLKNVSFTLKKDGNPVTLYQKPNTSEYKHARHTDSDNASYSETITDGKITTNVNGMLYLGLEQGTYTLTESPPFGYDGPSSITFSVDENGKIIKKDLNASTDNSETSTSDWVIASDNQALLTVKNTSKMLVTVTAKKVWEENTDEDKIRPVTVSLYRNGVKMSGDKYTQELSEKNNWVYTWHDLPLYVDDAIAEYSLREEKIGDTDYDLSNGSNGYRDYLVEYDSTKYVENLADSTHPEADTNWTGAGTSASWKDDNGSTVYAKHALLVVRNSEAQSDIVFKKTDSIGNALPGVVFGVYTDQDCKNLASKAESDNNGYVRFKAHGTVGETHTIYLKEISTPDGVKLSDTVYKINVSIGTDGKNSFKITDLNGTELSTAEDAQGNTYYQIQNQSAIALQIKKIGEDGSVLTGAKFKVTKDGQPFGGDNGVYEVTNADTGIVQIKDADGKLPEGKYRIEEISPPTGHPDYQLACPIDVTIQGGRVMYETDTTVSNTNKDAWQLVQREGTATYVLRVVNKAPSFLPSTGGSGILLPILFGTALMGGASALALWLRKRRKNG